VHASSVLRSNLPLVAGEAGLELKIETSVQNKISALLEAEIQLLLDHWPKVKVATASSNTMRVIHWRHIFTFLF
jgi:hypothetical protein